MYRMDFPIAKLSLKQMNYIDAKAETPSMY